MDKAQFKAICRAREICWGTVILENMSAHVVRAFARAGFEWIWLECEHAHSSYESVYTAARTAEDLGVATMLRVPQGEYAYIARGLDLGVTGIIVPRLESVEQARHIVACAKYPPVGRRGFGMRSSLFGKRSATMAERVEDQNNRRVLALQVESRKGVENLEGMLEAVGEWVDVVVFGPADFQMDIGQPDTPDAPELVEAVRHVSRVCEARGISTCTPVATIEGARRWRAFGFNLISVGSDDGFLLGGAMDAREGLRALG